MTEKYDVAIIGAGMAGASLAAEIGASARVLLLEAENVPGYHSTGRSAAFWETCYGGPEIVPLTMASGGYLREHGFLSERGALYLAREADQPLIDEFVTRFADTGAEFEQIDRASLDEMVPGLRPDWDRAIWQRACADIDVAGLHAHYLARAKRNNVGPNCHARVRDLTALSGGWDIQCEDGRRYTSKIVVNAAGAWADTLANLAGARPLGIRPLRRTVVQLRTDPPSSPDQPLCLDISGNFYFKPESGGRLWLSPHDETPTDPCDAAPEEFDVALAIDRFQNVTEWSVERVERKWAGLRSFAPDRRPVYGFDPRIENFFWFAGQGGYGIQTAPAAARLGAQLLLGEGRDELTRDLNAALYSPDRFC
ncbi:MAG: FAD-binding oxidoreductase [Altererythrobacter sp.]|nr:FAD-binding oxidoreductase [Altererythrobacter sp.]